MNLYIFHNSKPSFEYNVLCMHGVFVRKMKSSNGEIKDDSEIK